MNKLVIQGALLFLASEVVFALMAALVKHMAPTMPSAQLVFLRNIIALLVLLPYLRWRGQLQFRSDKLHFHLLRSGSGLANMYLYFFCLGVLPIGEAILLFQTAPIWIPFIASAWLGDRIKKRYWISALIGFVGVAFIVRTDDAQFSWLVALALFGAVLSAMNKCTIRRMADTEQPHQVVLYFTLFSALISALPMFWLWQTPALAQWPALILIGIGAILGQMLMTRAFMLVRPGTIGALGYAQVVFGFVLGAVFWQESVRFESLAGTLLIIIAGLIAMGLFVRRSQTPAGVPALNQPPTPEA